MGGRPKKVDYEKFKKMWMDGILSKDIAKEFGIRTDYVSTLSRVLDLPKRNRKKVDYKKFKKMWFGNNPARTIAKEFDIGILYVYVLRKKLFLPARVRERTRNVIKKIFDCLKNQPKNYIETSELKKHVSPGIVSRLIRKRKIFKVHLALSKGSGSYVRFSHDSMFKKEVYLKTFICLDRTAVVRLLIESCIYPEKTGERAIFTHFLKQNLSETERCAVLFKLGKRKWGPSSTKQSIQVNGVLIPTKRKIKKRY